MLRVGRNAACFENLLTQNDLVRRQQTGYRAALQHLESVRTDKQAGSSSGTGGTTSIVSKGTTARVLALAAEYGALRESVNNQVVTVQGSLDGIPSVLVRQDVFPYCPPDYVNQPGCVHQSLLGVLRRFSYSVSFNTTQNSNVSGVAGQQQGSAAPVTFATNSKQIAAVSGRLVAWSARDATSKEYETQWNQQLKDNADLQSAAQDLAMNLQTLLSNVEDTPEYLAWFTEAQRALTMADNTDLDTQWGIQASHLIDMIKTKHPEVVDQAATFRQALLRYRFEEDTFVESIANKPVLTLEYDNNRPILQPTTSTFRLIFDKGLRPWAFTANAAFELYDEQPLNISGAHRMRDAQVGLEIDRDLGNFAGLGASAFTAAYYFQYQDSPAILTVTSSTPVPGVTITGLSPGASEVFVSKGNLHIAQVKLVLGPGQSSVRFPVAVSYSNRTELIDKPTWRAQIGISYDFDALFSK